MGKRTPRIKLPGQSWTIKEKLDVVNALCADRHFSHGEARASVTMVLYFHNTANGHLFPSRQQVSEQCGVNKDVVISATRKMKRFGYLHYDQSTGGRNERNTYYLKKLTPKVASLHPETVGKSDSIDCETIGKSDTRGSENPTRIYPWNLPLVRKSAKPRPRPLTGLRLRLKRRSGHPVKRLWLFPYLPINHHHLNALSFRRRRGLRMWRGWMRLPANSEGVPRDESRCNQFPRL